MEPPEPGEEANYYAILNLSPDCKQEEVARQYRKLAQVFHPDKHTQDDLRATAQITFSKLQEAYEVLSDPQKRQVYDIYGKQGLQAGFEVGDKLNDVEELKKKWEEFKKKQEQERNESMANHKGTYMCKIDATKLPTSVARFWDRLVSGELLQQRPTWLGGQPAPKPAAGRGPLGQFHQQQQQQKAATPLFKVVVVQNSFDAIVGENDVVQVQGQAALRNNVGTGNIIFGYKRVISHHDSLDFSAVVGLRTVLSATVSRQLSPYTQASLTTTWNHADGLGLHVGSARTLPYNCQATWGWVVGPPAASGMTLGLVKRGARYMAAGKLEVGAVTSVSGRVTYQVAKDSNVRLIARLGTSGIDLEVGGHVKWDSLTSGYMGGVVGLQGIMLKLRLTRAGQTFECPLLLSTRPDDWAVLAATYTLPPLLYLGASRYVVRPLLAWHRQAKEAAERKERDDGLREGLKEAEVEQALIMPVACRKARAEMDRAGGGLVVLEAVYGELGTYFERYQPHPPPSPQQVLQREKAKSHLDRGHDGRQPRVPSQFDLSGATATTEPNPQQQPSSSGAGQEGPSSSSSSGSQPAASSPLSSSDLLLPFMYVTPALQYLVADSKLTLHRVAKSGLMGFADPAPSSTKQLYVAYLHQGVVYEVTIEDQALLDLPGDGTPVTDMAKAALLRARTLWFRPAEQQGQTEQPAAVPSGGIRTEEGAKVLVNPLFSPDRQAAAAAAASSEDAVSGPTPAATSGNVNGQGAERKKKAAKPAAPS